MRRNLIIIMIVLVVVIRFSMIRTDDNSYDKEAIDNQEVLEETSYDLFEPYYRQAQSLLDEMSLEEKVDQMFYVRYPGKEEALKLVEDYSPAGFILFSKDFDNHTSESILDELNNLQVATYLPLFLGVDEEGGTVVRVSSHSSLRSSRFLSPQSLYDQGGLSLIESDCKEKSQLLKSLGINMNLSPVVDVCQDSSSFMYARSYGQGADETAQYAKEIVEIMNDSSIISTMKHFPGYGDNGDTHNDVSIDKRSYSDFESSDFLPFISGIEANCPSILVSHNIVLCMDSEKPASLSAKVHDILRNDLGFSGLIITDDLDMDAIKQYSSDQQVVVEAINAGNDLIITSDFESQRTIVLDALEKGQIEEEVIDKAVKRILACKYCFGLL